MLEMGVIEESHSNWASSIVLVCNSVRFCVDYHKVNAVSKFDAYPMPQVDELLDLLGTPLSPLSKEQTAFTKPFGLHQFVTLPFGLFGALATFQHLMDRILRPHTTYAAAYLDDILIYTSPLNYLTTKEAPDLVQWTERCQQAFTQIKAALWRTATALS